MSVVSANHPVQMSHRMVSLNRPLTDSTPTVPREALPALVLANILESYLNSCFRCQKQLCNGITAFVNLLPREPKKIKLCPPSAAISRARRA